MSGERSGARLRVPRIFRQAWIAAVSPVTLVSTWWLYPKGPPSIPIMVGVYACGAVLVLLSIGARRG